MNPSAKFIALTEPLYDYVLRHRSGADDPLLAELRAETRRLGDDARMQVSAEQGSFLQLLVAVTGARAALEIGTFTGYSALCMARGLPEDGRLLCLDTSVEWTRIAQGYWNRAGVSPKIDLRLGPALDLLRQMEPGPRWDFVFIDAEKTEYDAYYELVLPRVRPNGLILFDNMLWGGRVISQSPPEPSTRALNALNCKLAGDPRVEAVLLPIADGLQLCRKRPEAS